ncbi:hypothetical protein [Paenibacillus sp. 598K]|uniref:hypothetical protein n=1 Tax=Paenibacillus sp. 598K TaxID=1117987 RepID=UPI000FFF076B|nr:hypothetical protein [Paenibacillus sp. 598K]
MTTNFSRFASTTGTISLDRRDRIDFNVTGEAGLDITWVPGSATGERYFEVQNPGTYFILASITIANGSDGVFTFHTGDLPAENNRALVYGNGPATIIVADIYNLTANQRLAVAAAQTGTPVTVLASPQAGTDDITYAKVTIIKLA